MIVRIHGFHLLRVRLQCFKDKDLTRILQTDGERKRGNIKMKNRNKTKNYNDVTDRAEVQLGFCSHYLFARSPFSVQSF